MKFKRKNPEVDHLTLDNFNIRFSADKVEIETIDKHWKQTLAYPSKPYAIILSLRARNDSTAIHTLCYALYSTTLFFYYPDLCIKWIQTSNDKVKEVKEYAEKLSAMPTEDLKDLMDVKDLTADDVPE